MLLILHHTPSVINHHVKLALRSLGKIVSTGDRTITNYGRNDSIICLQTQRSIYSFAYIWGNFCTAVKK